MARKYQTVGMDFVAVEEIVTPSIVLTYYNEHKWQVPEELERLARKEARVTGAEGEDALVDEAANDVKRRAEQVHSEMRPEGEDQLDDETDKEVRDRAEQVQKKMT